MQQNTATALLFRTGQIEVEVRPAEGGRIASLLSLASGQQFLTAARSSERSLEAGMDADFQQGACAGIEECLPTVGRCGDSTSGGPVPDHGDFWQIPWSVQEQDAHGCVLAAEGFSRPLHFQKRIEVLGDTLRIEYTIRNVGTEPQSFLYACHPLFAVEAGDRILLPDGVTTLRLDYRNAEWPDARDGTVSWPRTAAGEVLDRVLSEDAKVAAMLYTGRIQTGACGIERAATGERLLLEYEHRKLPYLGVWLCYAGWPENGSAYRQYAVALEPTTASRNTLQEAQAAGEAIPLAAGEEYRFWIAFRIVPGRP